MRSTHAPAGSPTTRNATVWNAVSRPTWKVDACTTRIATSGRASWLIIVPNWLTVSPIHSRRKSRWRQGRSGSRATGAILSRVIGFCQSLVE